MSDEQERLLAAQQQMAQQQFNADVQAMEEAGYDAYGQNSFDEKATIVREKLGDRMTEFLAVLAPFDKAPDIIAHLGDNPDRAEQISRLSTARMVAEVGCIAGQLSPHGRPNAVGNTPAYKHPSSRGGRVPDDVWRAGGDNLNDSQWHKEFDRRLKERAGKPHVSTEAQRWAERVKRG